MIKQAAEALNSLQHDNVSMTGADRELRAENKTQGMRRYKVCKDADARIKAASDGYFSLAAPIYKGDDQPHWLVDRAGRPFFVSLNDVLREGYLASPYEHSVPDDLRRFGNDRILAKYVHSISNGYTEFVPGQPLGHADNVYAFRCMIHDGTCFTLTFREFCMLAQTSGGCAHCEAKS